LAHIFALFHLKRLKTEYGCDCSVLVSDLGAFLDKAKCSWAQLKSRTAYYMDTLKAVMKALGLEGVSILQSSEYQFSEPFTLEMYKAVGVLTRDETTLLGDGANTLSCNLAPVYFALDVKQSGADAVLIGPNQKPFMELYNKLVDRLNWPTKTSIIMLEIVGMDGARMSATRPDFHLDPQDGTKKIRQKIAKSFCEPGNLQGNVALAISRTILFPLLLDENNGKADEVVFNVERSAENGGNLTIRNYAELESVFLSLALHPADLKSAVVSRINALFEAIRANLVPDSKSK